MPFKTALTITQLGATTLKLSENTSIENTNS